VKAAVALLLVAPAMAAAAPVLDSSVEIHPGIQHDHYTDATIPAKLDVVAVDISDQEIGLVATTEQQAGMTTSAFASAVGAQVAINGDLFSPAGFVPRGLAIGNGVPWSDSHDDTAAAVFFFHPATTGDYTVAGTVVPQNTTVPADLPADVAGAVSGQPMLVQAGKAGSFDCTDPSTIACMRAPRSALALSADGRTLWLVTVDGWQSASIGMTDMELAPFLVSLGADAAIALDSGASSTLVLDGAVVNHPSDGIERAVANHLAVKFGSLPRGELAGDSCYHDAVNCDGDSSQWLGGVEVTLDDGTTFTTPDSPSAPRFHFPNLRPRVACVTGRKTGFLTTTRCGKVPAGDIGYASLLMYEGMDPPDAGIAPDAPLPADAAQGNPDNNDAGPRVGPPGGGCCDAGRDRPAWWLAAVVGWFLTRRGVRAERSEAGAGGGAGSHRMPSKARHIRGTTGSSA
jgi:hypothetical protein